MWGKKHPIPNADELWEGEIWVKDHLIDKYGWPLSKEVVEGRMHLAITSSLLDKDLEAILVPDDNQDYNGRILINSLYEDDGEFEYMHEVIHYVLDVGVGKKVNTEFSRHRTGNSNDAHERIVDYYAAVALAPGEKLVEDIKRYRKKWFVTDEASFMRELQKKYSCSEECIRQRFKEVHRLIRKKKMKI